MDFSQLIRQLKSNLKFLVIGLLIISLLAFGFAVAVTLLIIVVIATPIIRLWKGHKAGGGKRRERDIDDFIDVEYKIVEKTGQHKKKDE